MLETLFAALGIDGEEVVENIKGLFEFLYEAKELTQKNHEMLKLLCDYWKIDYEVKLLEKEQNA